MTFSGKGEGSQRRGSRSWGFLVWGTSRILLKEGAGPGHGLRIRDVEMAAGKYGIRDVAVARQYVWRATRRAERCTVRDVGGGSCWSREVGKRHTLLLHSLLCTSFCLV